MLLRGLFLANLSIVIDADIARSSGLSEHPISSGSRNLLDNVSTNGHKVVMCPLLMEEWRKHRSVYARTWLASMIAKRRVTFVKEPDILAKSYLLEHIEDTSLREVALKDVHLVDAALKYDNLIASNDDRARNAFCGYSVNTGIWRNVAWINAISHGEFLKNYLLMQGQMPDDHKLF